MLSVYLETSVIGYLSTRPSSNPITAGNQNLTEKWWNSYRQRFDLYVSQAVVAECSAGDSSAAEERLEYLEGLPILEITEDTHQLAAKLIAEVPLPQKAEIDALHIAVAALNGIDYLLTWNCKHIANPSLRRIIDDVLWAEDLIPSVICTPQEFINV